ncbi:nucleotide exchange factor GrpE [Kitasatospora sp. NPDC097643]|uniref:nucleotide exchange factor GrpE n=1 Tax=Kitasatospora sp. NPDC097643 TaxID=3157230 RepID=UPI00332E94F0
MDETPPEATGPAELHEAVRALGRSLAAQTEQAARREEIITRLHDENQRLRRGEIAAAVDLVRHGLIRLHDRITVQARQLDAPLNLPELRALLEALAQEAAETLATTGVDRYDPVPGTGFDHQLHRAVGRVAAAAPEQDGSVTEVRAAGFRQDDRIVRKSEVVVARWSEPPADGEPGRAPSAS